MQVFRILDVNYNGSLEVDEIADAVRPYEITIDERQAEEVRYLRSTTTIIKWKPHFQRRLSE